MDRLEITGGKALNGEITISGAKNAALPIMAACLLTEKPLLLNNVPHLADVTTMATLLGHLGVDFTLFESENRAQGHSISLDASKVENTVAPYDIVRKMRASFTVLGPLLARFNKATVSLPGGCAIGTRPINYHLDAFQKMGAEIDLEDGYVKASAPNGLQGAEISMPTVSVGATENVMMAATLANGTTVINNAASEPEVSDLAHCLNAMGAKIEGIDTNTLTIHGVENLDGTTHNILPDRIETGTYAIAAAITGGDITLHNIAPHTLASIIGPLEDSGTSVEVNDNTMRIHNKNKQIDPLDITTAPYPAFATDMQAQFMALMTVSSGVSNIKETIFENRFIHAQEMMRMGANITIDGSMAVVKGVNQLHAAEVMASDLRASVGLVLAALAAEGTTIINRIYHLDRGYEELESKLRACGADIRRVS